MLIVKSYYLSYREICRARYRLWWKIKRNIGVYRGSIFWKMWTRSDRWRCWTPRAIRRLLVSGVSRLRASGLLIHGEANFPGIRSMTNAVAPYVLVWAVRGHVVQHTLAQWCDRPIIGQGRHGKRLSFKRTPPCSKTSGKPRYNIPSTPAAKRLRA